MKMINKRSCFFKKSSIFEKFHMRKIWEKADNIRNEKLLLSRI